jgi:hypothetical protein
MCVYVYMYVCMCFYVCVCVYVCMYVCMCVCALPALVLPRAHGLAVYVDVGLQEACSVYRRGVYIVQVYSVLVCICMWMLDFRRSIYIVYI